MGRPKKYLSEEDARRGQAARNQAAYQRRTQEASQGPLQFVLYEPVLPGTPPLTSAATGLRSDLEIPAMAQDLIPPTQQAIIISNGHPRDSVVLPLLPPLPLPLPRHPAPDREPRGAEKIPSYLDAPEPVDPLYEETILSQIREIELQEAEQISRMQEILYPLPFEDESTLFYSYARDPPLSPFLSI